MINFSSKQYEWQENMDVIMQCVNLNRIGIENNFKMVFDFLNSYDGKHYKKIVCHSVWKFSSDVDLSPEDEFPFFICDVRIIKLEKDDIHSAFANFGFGLAIPESEEYYLLCMDDGDISISLICQKVEVLDM